MNLELVFVKTAAGEEVLASPDKNGGEGGRLPRAFRTVLILVDGKLTVADLGEKMSSLDFVKMALADLEDRGYIVRCRTKAGDSIAVPENARIGAETGAVAGATRTPAVRAKSDEADDAEKMSVETIELFGVEGVTESDFDWAYAKPQAGGNRASPSKMASTVNDNDDVGNVDGLPILMEVVDPSQTAEIGEFTEHVDFAAEDTADAAMTDAESPVQGRTDLVVTPADTKTQNVVDARSTIKTIIGKLTSLSGRWWGWRNRRLAAQNQEQTMQRPYAPHHRETPSRYQIGRPGRLIYPARRSSGMKTLITLVLLIFLGAAVFVAFPPLTMYVASIEAAASNSLGRPVKIGRLSASVYPHLGILLADVVIDAPDSKKAVSGANETNEGNGSEMDQPIHIAKIWLEPDVRTLFASRKDLRRVFVSGIVLTPEVFAALPAMLQQINGNHSEFRVAGLYFEQLALDIPKLSIGPLQGLAELSETAGLSALNLQTDKRKLKLVLTPDGQRINFEAEGRAIRIPALAPVDFNSISVKGVWENGEMNVSAFDFRLFDGAIIGQVKARLEETVAVEGDLTFDHVDSGKLSTALGVENLLAGDLEGKARFSGTANEWNGILPALTVEGSFLMQRGSLTGIDLAEAARRISEMPVQGGMMSFEQFSGKMRLMSSRLRFYDLKVESGLMSSVGSAEVTADQTLNGRMDLQMHGSVNQVRVPIVLGGTLQSPTARAVRPQRNATVVAPPTLGAGASDSSATQATQAGAQTKARDAGSSSASRDNSDNILLPSVRPAQF